MRTSKLVVLAKIVFLQENCYNKKNVLERKGLWIIN